MVDTKLLEKRIEESGKSYEHLAKACGITVQSLRLKRLGLRAFKTTEVSTLCSELSITKLTDKERIFFSQKVDKNET